MMDCRVAFGSRNDEEVALKPASPYGRAIPTNSWTGRNRTEAMET